MRSAPASRYSRWMRLTTSGGDRLRMSTLFLSSLGRARNRSPRQSSSVRHWFCRGTPIDPSKITIRCLNSRSRRSRVEVPGDVAVAMWTPKSTNLVPDRAPHLEYAVVVEHAAPAHGEVADGRLAHRRVGEVGRGSELDVRGSPEYDVAGCGQFVGEVVDGVAGAAPGGPARSSRHRRRRREA